MFKILITALVFLVIFQSKKVIANSDNIYREYKKENFDEEFAKCIHPRHQNNISKISINDDKSKVIYYIADSKSTFIATKDGECKYLGNFDNFVIHGMNICVFNSDYPFCQDNSCISRNYFLFPEKNYANFYSDVSVAIGTCQHENGSGKHQVFELFDLKREGD